MTSRWTAVALVALAGCSSRTPGAAPDNDTWGRLPDGTGAFAVTAQTPGAANTAP